MNNIYRIIIYGLNHHSKYFDNIEKFEGYAKELMGLRQSFQKQVQCEIHGWAPMRDNGCFHCSYDRGLKWKIQIIVIGIYIKTHLMVFRRYSRVLWLLIIHWQLCRWLALTGQGQKQGRCWEYGGQNKW